MEVEVWVVVDSVLVISIHLNSVCVMRMNSGQMVDSKVILV